MQSVLEIDLSRNLSFQLPQGYYLNAPDSKIDTWQWRLVMYRGFDHEGILQEPDEEVAKAGKHLEIPEYIKVFAIKDGEYAAHCGVWYNSLGKYQIQGRRKEQLYTKDKTALNVILSDCTRLRTFSQYVYGGSIFHS